MEKILLIDGHSILHRAFYGMPDLTAADGRHTGAVYGFLNILFKLLDEEQPDYLAVAFDVHAPTFRHEVYEQYKGTRKPMPEELREQVPLIKEVLKAMNIAVIEQAGLEADDLLGTLAKKSEAQGMDVSLVSGDRDLLQIATDRICVRIPKTVKGRTDIYDYYADDVLREYQVTPEQFIDVKALMGDASDNVPGIPKVGEKTAVELIKSYGSVNGVYEHLDEIKKPALKKNLEENRELADLSLFLVTIKTDADAEPDKDAFRTGNYYTPEARALFQSLGFRNYLQRFTDVPDGPDTAQADVNPFEKYIRIFEKDSLDKLLEDLKDAGRIGLYLLTEEDEYHLPQALFGIGLCCADRSVFIRIRDGLHNAVTTERAVRFLSDLRKNTRADLALWDMKGQFAYWGFEPEKEFGEGIHLDRMWDCHLMQYLLNPLESTYTIERLLLDYRQTEVKSIREVIGKTPLAIAMCDQEETLEKLCCAYAGGLLGIMPELREKLHAEGMEDLYTGMERPVSYILYDMHQLGIRVDPQALTKYGEELSGRIAELEEIIHEEAGDPDFNIASPKQLGVILFEKLHLPGGKKTKSGYSTAADVLEKLAPDYPLAAYILEYRALTKLKSTYADGLSQYIAPDLRIHTTLHQTVTATGRLSSADPNLQNIPMRTDLGKKIRKCFLPKDGYLFTDADYSQIELRILAHMSGDEQLIEAYRENKDIHRITASRVFHTPFENVTPLQRRNAKAVNFGIVYGISSFGLSQDLSISRAEEADYIEAYFATYPGVKRYLDSLVAFAKENGYVRTLYGRKRPIPELKSSNFMQRQFGERVAMNSPLQGTAADIMKIAMIRVYEAIIRKNMKSRMILQIHDELLIETAPGEEESIKQILTEEMMHAADLKVSLEVDVESGSDWYIAK